MIVKESVLRRTHAQELLLDSDLSARLAAGLSLVSADIRKSTGLAATAKAATSEFHCISKQLTAGRNCRRLRRVAASVLKHLTQLLGSCMLVA